MPSVMHPSFDSFDISSWWSVTNMRNMNIAVPIETFLIYLTLKILKISKVTLKNWPKKFYTLITLSEF